MPAYSTLCIDKIPEAPCIARPLLMVMADDDLWFQHYAQAEGLRAAVERRDSGRPAPQGDDGRERIRNREARRR